jgi:hypothetical protein
MIGLPVEKRLAILAEYDAGGISQTELAAKHGVGESTISTWRRRLPPVERKCTVCGSPVPLKTIAWRGSLLCKTCSRAKKTAAHRIYYAAHKEEIDSAHTYEKRSALSKAIVRDRCAERWFRNQETLKRLLKRMIDSLGEWEEHYSLVGGEQLSSPTFVIVSKSGVKRKEVLTEPLPSWD